MYVFIHTYVNCDYVCVNAIIYVSFCFFFLSLFVCFFLSFFLQGLEAAYIGSLRAGHADPDLEDDYHNTEEAANQRRLNGMLGCVAID